MVSGWEAESGAEVTAYDPSVNRGNWLKFWTTSPIRLSAEVKMKGEVKNTDRKGRIQAGYFMLPLGWVIMQHHRRDPLAGNEPIGILMLVMGV